MQAQKIDIFERMPKISSNAENLTFFTLLPPFLLLLLPPFCIIKKNRPLHYINRSVFKAANAVWVETFWEYIENTGTSVDSR